MKALVLYGPGNYGFDEDYPKPKPKSGWAVVKVYYAGICGSDLPRFAITGSYHHPMILGHEFMGVVDTPAPDSKKYTGGEMVAVLPLIPCGHCPGCRNHEPFHCENYRFLGSRNDGGFAEYCLVPEENLFCLPEKIDPKVGAIIEPLAVALHVVRRSGFQQGQSALVFGAGPIGLLIAMWLNVFGASEITMADIRSESLQVARKMGIESAMNPTDKEFDSVGPFDSVFEAAGSGKALPTAIEKTKRKGRLTIVGRDTKETSIPLQAFEQMMRKEITIKGCWGYNLNGEYDLLREKLAENCFEISPMISHEVSLNDAVETINRMIARNMYYCKVLLKP